MADATAVSKKNEKIGEVTSTKMAKTIVVVVTRRVPHPIYKRIVTKRSKFYAHDEKGEAKLGDVVCIQESRPLSALKRWTLKSIVRQADQVKVSPTVGSEGTPTGAPVTKKKKQAAK